MCKLRQILTKYTPQPTFFNGVYIVYFCMHGLSRAHTHPSVKRFIAIYSLLIVAIKMDPPALGHAMEAGCVDCSRLVLK